MGFARASPSGNPLDTQKYEECVKFLQQKIANLEQSLG
jgi:hypothetical protein